MKKAILAVNIVLCALLVLFFALSVADTEEVTRKTEMDTFAISRHIEKLSENGPRSLFHPEANEAARDYIVSALEESGLVNEDTTKAPAYQVQDYVAHDEEYQNFYLSNVIAHIPANGENPSDEAILFMAHYDSVPMGQGASDDGVSVATMLEAIDYFTARMAEGYTLNNDLVFAFVNGEEFGLYGSKAFMGLDGEPAFAGFDNITERIRFGVNLESRGTSGTVIMFETAANNYHTIELFSKLNKSVFSCSIATLVYDMMPNYTDFTSIKDVYQGVNMANITGGENYHTQNDSPENVGMSYLSQQAEIVHDLIDGMGNFDLDTLYEAEESAIFFTYLNVTTVIYNHAANVALAVIALLLLVLNILLRALYRKETHGWAATGKAVGVLVLALVLAAVFDNLIFLLPSRTARAVRHARVHNHACCDHHAARFKLAVHLTEQTVIDAGLDQGVAKPAQCRAVRHFVVHAETREAAEGKTVVHLFLYLAITQAVPHAHKLNAEQHHAVVTRTARLRKTFGIGWFYQGTERLPVYHCIYLVEKLGFHFTPLQLQVAKAQLGCLFSFHALKLLIFLQYTKFLSC